MKFKIPVILFVLLVWVTVHAGAQLYKPFASFRVIKTEHFEIVFPKESEYSAQLLASYADSVYKEISSLLGIEVRKRIPVTFAPHTDLFNGYYNPITAPHIVLFDTPMDLEWTNFEDSLKALFVHELTHAISLNTRGGAWRWLNRVFGAWATPAFFTAPQFMVEGVTISMESLTGFGRANDPLIKQILRQAIQEDKFLTPFQASGVYDSPGQRGAWYDYGGLFSYWLIQNYGMEKYAKLWQAMGRSSGFSFIVYRSGFYKIFKKTYGMDFTQAWSMFSDSLALKGVEENNDEIISGKYHFFFKQRNSFPALAAHGSSVYTLNGSEGKIHSFEGRSGNVKTFNAGLLRSYDLDVSPDGKLLLVSGYTSTGDRYRAAVTEHRSDTGRKTGRSIHGLYRARYFRDGVIGIQSELHNNHIVYEEFNGTREILFRGTEELLFSGPQALDNERIVFIAASKGLRQLLLYNYVSGELFRFEGSDDDGGPRNHNMWRYIRGLGVSEGKLFFSHNADDRMYKLGCIDPETMLATYSNRDFSGGVFNPVSAGGIIYYRGIFFSGDGLMRHPESALSLSGIQSEIKLVKIDGGNYGLAPRSPFPSGTDSLHISPKTTPYLGFTYMNPLKFWLPLPLLRLSLYNNRINADLDGAGLLTVMMDPTDRNLIIAMAYADITYRMAMIDTILWQSTLTGFPLTLEFSDKVIADSIHIPYRSTRVNLIGSLTRVPGRWAYTLSLGAGYTRFADRDSTGSAYKWEETESRFYYSAGLSFSNLLRKQHELFGTGLSLGIRGLSTAGIPFRESFKPRVEGLFRAGAEIRFPLNLVLYGAYDEPGMNLHGVSRTYGQPIFSAAASTEYPHPWNLDLSWIGGAEMSVGLFSFEIQRNLSHAYFNRVFGSLALRSVLYDSKGHGDAEGFELNNLHLAQSLILKLGLVSAFLPIKQVPVFVEPNFWGAWKFSSTFTGKGFPWNFGIGVNLRI